MNLDACRSCGSTDLHAVLSLGEMPLANALLTEDQLVLAENRYPLDVATCSSCALVQLTDTVPPDELFVEYAYFSSSSSPMVGHALELVERTIADRGLDSSDLVVEIASNDGYLLKHYLDKDVPVLGIDPAANVVDVARERGVETRCDFFTSALATELESQGVRASVVHANNVLAHVPNINDLVTGVAILLAEGGTFIVETPYVRDMIEKLEFDTIYHEHVFYYSLHALNALFERNGLRITKVEHIPIHGGSLRVHAVSSDSDEETDPGVATMLADEARMGMTTPGFYGEFSQRVEGLLRQLREFLAGRKAEGRRIAGYGAAAKATVLLNALGIGRETFDFIVDDTPYKQGRFMPGVHIPIYAPDRLLSHFPDDVMIFAWNFSDAIIAKESEYISRGGTFLLPLPTPTEVAL